MKLELKHLAPYLPFELKLYQPVKGNTYKNGGYYRKRKMTVNNVINTISRQERIKPILRPISDLLDESKEYFKIIKRKSLWMDCQNSSYSDFEIQCHELINNTGCISISVNFKRDDENISLGFVYNDYQWLLENHFDIFGLIEKGLAIDINTI